MKRVVIILVLLATIALVWTLFLKKGPGDLAALNQTLDKEAIQAQIQEAVNEGKLTQEQAKAKLQWLEQAEIKQGK